MSGRRSSRTQHETACGLGSISSCPSCQTFCLPVPLLSRLLARNGRRGIRVVVDASKLVEVLVDRVQIVEDGELAVIHAGVRTDVVEAGVWPSSWHMVCRLAASLLYWLLVSKNESFICTVADWI